MSGTIGFSITTKIGNALGVLGRIGSRINNLGKQKDIAAKKAQTFGQRMQGLSTAMARMGGPMGSMASQIGGGAGMAGALGKVAVAAAIAGMAWRAYARSQEAAQRRVRAQIAAEKELMDTMRKARTSRAGSERAGAATAEGMRRFVAAGGDTKQVEGLSEHTGIPMDQIAAGMTSFIQKKGRQANFREIQAALLLQRTGRGEFGASMESLAGMRYHDYEEPTQLARRVAAAGGERRTTREQIAEEYGRVRSDPTMQTLDRMNVLGRDRGHAEFGQVGSGALETSLRTALAEAIDPVSVAMAERNKQKDAEINALYRQMEEEGAWSRMHKALSGQVTARRTYNEAVESRDPEPRRRRMAPGGLVRDPNDYPLAQAIQQKISLVLDAISRKMDGGEFFGNTLNRTNDARDAAPGSLQ